ncbi:MAG: hypothetical protein JWO38_2893 [Gemmataceae bacterium]|nr:hypothetical protein [Gemmataceae bacterium]
MSRTFCLTLLTAAFCVAVGAAPTPPEKKTPTIKGWGDVTDPDGDCRVAEDKGVLTITVPKTHHDLTYTDEYTKLNSPRVLQRVEGDFTLRVKIPAFPLPGDVASSGGQHSFVSTGLLIWQDDKNFIRMERAAVAKGETPFVWVERFADGKSAAHHFSQLADKDTGLRVVRKGNKFTFLYDDGGEGKDWAEAHVEDIELPAKIQVGVTAINTTVREFAPKLTGLELGPKK